MEVSCWEVIDKYIFEVIKLDEFIIIDKVVFEILVKRDFLFVSEVELFEVVNFWVNNYCEI